MEKLYKIFQYQRQLALKRIHDQERELHMRQEQQIQQYRLNNAYGSLPYIPPAQPSKRTNNSRGVFATYYDE